MRCGEAFEVAGAGFCEGLGRHYWRRDIRFYTPVERTPVLCVGEKRAVNTH